MISQFIGEFDCFVELYAHYMCMKHYLNPHWRTKEQVIENSGGEDELYGLYCLWTQVSEAKQREICGCTMTQVKFMLNTISTFELEDSDETLSHLVECLAILNVLWKRINCVLRTFMISKVLFFVRRNILIRPSRL